MQHRHPQLVGRADELSSLKSIVTAARNGSSGAVVVRGDPGIGKSALLEAATSGQAGIRLIRGDGYEAEASLPYAALQRVGLALSDHLDALPARQRTALRVAWAAEDGPAPDRFLVGVAVLALFAEAGRGQPVVCVVDDAHWLDSESLGVLAFVARRLQAEATVLLFATRDDENTDIQLAGVPSVRLSGLATHAALELLGRAAPEAVDPFPAVQIATATAGNPLALIELAHDLSIRQLVDLSLTAGPVPIGRYLEAHYLRQVRNTSPDVQAWLQLAAAASTGQPVLIARAADRLGLSPDAADEAERAGLVTLGDTVAFRHPLVRSAVYGATRGADRRRSHATLAHEAGLLGLVELETWHSAEATVGPDSEVADRLEAASEIAARRGGLVSRAGLLLRAAELTTPGAERNGRFLAAAEAASAAGAVHLAGDLLDRIQPTELDAVQRGRMILARTELAVFVADPAAVRRATVDLIEAADEFNGRDPEREQRALVRAFELVLMAERITEGATLADIGRRLELGSRVGGGPYSVILRALAGHILAPYGQAVPLMREAMDVLSALDDSELPNFGFVGVAFTTALFDVDGCAAHLDRLERISRDAASLRFLDTVLWVRSLFELDRGDPAAAGRYIELVRELRRAIGYSAENVVNASYLAWTGTPVEQVEAIAEVIYSMGFGGAHNAAMTGLAVRDIAEGRYGEAFKRLQPMVDVPFLHVTYIVLADMVESATRSGHLGAAEGAADQISAMASASGTPRLRGLDLRCRALLAPDAEAEALYRGAIGVLSDASTPVDLGRAHLLYGEWLRRSRRRREARDQLKAALHIFERVHAPSFAQRARAELEATGELITDREVVGGVAMSPREAVIARMAAAGQTNADIGSELFISANTVDYHLRKVFSKLGISSRRQLGEWFDTTE